MSSSASTLHVSYTFFGTKYRGLIIKSASSRYKRRNVNAKMIYALKKTLVTEHFHFKSTSNHFVGRGALFIHVSSFLKSMAQKWQSQNWTAFTQFAILHTVTKIKSRIDILERNTLIWAKRSNRQNVVTIIFGIMLFKRNFE